MLRSRPRPHPPLAYLLEIMVRRFANQVHQQVSRLMRAEYITKEPVWYQAVLQYPPLPLPPRAPPARTEYDHRTPVPSVIPGQPIHMRRMKSKPLPIRYIEDDLRRQFFRDHPFEAFRPTTLVEGARIEPPHSVNGEGWTRLRQRGRNPSPEEYVLFCIRISTPLSSLMNLPPSLELSAIRFAVNLYQHHDLNISEAYLRAVAQFRALRSEHHIATTYATLEAETFGAIFENMEIENAFEKERKALELWKQEEQMDESALVAKKRWKAIVERDIGESEWTKGEEYVRLWKENIKAEYAPQITEPIAETSTKAAATSKLPVTPSGEAKVHVTAPRHF